MAEPHFANDDDLPRTLRRERDARDREARERELRDREGALAAAAAHAQDPRHMHGPGSSDFGHQAYAPSEPSPAYQAPAFSGTVNRIEVPFRHLVWFFLKAVIAAIPALILLTVLLIAGGQALKAFFPALRQLEIVVRSTGPAAVVEPVVPAAPATPKAPAAKR